jgi:hypothetical protein
MARTDRAILPAAHAPVAPSASRVVPSATAPTALLLRAYADPPIVRTLDAHQWMALVGAARRARCLGHVALRFAQSGVLDRVEPRVLEQFQSAAMVIRRRRQALRWELRELAEALDDLPFPIVALKGMAYEISGLPLAGARLASDVDLLVPPDDIAVAESRLRSLGWASVELSDYDERYYREWSHEIPAMSHPMRGVEVDVHHSIAPGLPGHGAAAQALMDASEPVSWHDGSARGATARFRVLQPVDQLVHVAIHTFCGSDLSLRLREVMDFDLLYRHRCIEHADTDAAALLERAARLGVARPVWWMLHYAARWLGTPVPRSVLEAPARAGAPVRALMDRLVDRAMLPGLRQRRTHREFAAELALLARYQWQRLPLRRLVPHVLEKARRRLLDRES